MTVRRLAIAVGPRRWLGIAGLWAAYGAFLTHQSLIFHSLRSGGAPISILDVATRDFVVAAAWAVLTPVVLMLSRHQPVDAGAPRLAVHAIMAPAIAAVHVTVVHVAIASPGAALWSPATASLFTWDALAYVLIAGWAHARRYAIQVDEQEVTRARLAAAAAEARWRAANAATRPELLLAVLARLERLVFEDVARAERVMEQLAELLRASVDAADVDAADGDAAIGRTRLDRLEAAVAATAGVPLDSVPDVRSRAGRSDGDAARKAVASLPTLAPTAARA